MTLGFDPKKDCYVGTFVGSMMANLWLYEGTLDAMKKRLPLVTEGQAFTGDGTYTYRDTIEIIDTDHWLFTSEYQNEVGERINFMNGIWAQKLRMFRSRKCNADSRRCLRTVDPWHLPQSPALGEGNRTK